MNYTKLPKKVLLLLATPVMLSLAVPAGKLMAQSQTETKIRLMAEALRARDSGDLVTAKTNLEQLLVLAPSDVTVQRLLAGVNENIASGSGAAESAVPAAAVNEPVPEIVYTPGKPNTAPVEAAVEAPAETSAPAEPDAPVVASPDEISAELAAAEEARVRELLVKVKEDRSVARGQAKDGDFAGAATTLAAAAASLPVTVVTQPTLDEITKQQNEMLLQKSQYLLEKGDTKGAREALDAYVAATSFEGRSVRRQSSKIDEVELSPDLQPIEKLNPEFIAEQKKLAALSARGRAQYAAGAFDEAQETFQTIETLSADNAEAKYFLTSIAKEKARLGVLNRRKTSEQMVEEVAKSWQRPGVFLERPPGDDRPLTPTGELVAKMDSIIIPTVSFTGVDLGRVISTLGALSEEFDPAPTNKGVNLVLSNPLSGTPVPQVNITLRNLSLRRILDIITENVGYQYIVDADLVQIRPSGGDVNLETEQFAINRATLTRMTGVGAASAGAPAASADPFAATPAPSAGGGGSGGEADSIRRFFQAAGINFEGVPGSSLAYDGTGIIVTQTGRNIEKIRNVLARYNDIRQVEIEAKFMDVQQGELDELGIAWQGAFRESGNDWEINSDNRSLRDAFTGSTGGGAGSITTIGLPTVTIPNSIPSLPGAVDIGGNAASVAAFTGFIGAVSVEAQLRAISRRQGTDLLSAPKVTVLSGNRATITVAQELRFPQSYGEIESEVGTSGNTGGGSAGVTITAATPEDFTTRNVGVELNVTPTVEEDDYSISLELNPRVTEFEGFVEYGGQSIAISGPTTVTIPSGFYQPIFSLREINTRVTVWDGATLVMGGLTREEVRRVKDKVPILGDIPYLGRAFRSEGESSQKRNLLVFVTANLVSPGGSLKKQTLKGVAPSSLFQNPTVVTPGGSESRLRGTVE
jgi:general secretion pathway protein D